MTTRTEWLKTGEPIGNNRVEVTLRTTYHTGPQESRDDDVIRGTATMDIFDVIQNSTEVQEHTHDDGSIMLSGLSDETRTELLKSFEEFDELTKLLRQGCSPAEAVDYVKVEREGWTQTAWASLVRDADQSTVSENVAKARKRIQE
jgi:hypothetical protein